MAYSIKVDGMMCSHCASRVEAAAKSVEGVTDAKVSLDDKTVTVDGNDCTLVQVRKAIADAGYNVM